VCHLDRPHAPGGITRPQGDAVAQRQDVEPPLDLRAKRGPVGGTRLCRELIACRHHCGNQCKHVNDRCPLHCGESSSDPSNRCNPNKASAPTTIRTTMAPETCGVTNVPAA